MSSRRSGGTQKTVSIACSAVFAGDLCWLCLCSSVAVWILEIDRLIPGFSGRLRPHSAGRGMSDAAVYALEAQEATAIQQNVKTRELEAGDSKSSSFQVRRGQTSWTPRGPTSTRADNEKFSDCMCQPSQAPGPKSFPTTCAKSFWKRASSFQEQQSE